MAKHWTQLPGGREKLARAQQARWKRYRQAKNGQAETNGIHASNHAEPAQNLEAYRQGFRDGFAEGRKA